MQKSPETTQSEVREPGHTKTRRNHKPTACHDLRRTLDHCGICGSANVVTQGAVECKLCDYIEEFLYAGTGWQFMEVVLKKECGHGRYLQQSAKRSHCLDCGAVNGPLCPSCHRPAWGKGMQVYCRDCGFSGESKV